METVSTKSENKKDYDIFVCYDEITGKASATMVHRALTSRCRYRVFVAHIERSSMSGDYRTIIDNMI